MYSLSEKSFFEPSNNRKKNFALSLGIILPFQPCMEDKKVLQNCLKELQEKVFIKLHKTLHNALAEIMFQRLQVLFNRLDHHSQCKSVAIVIAPYEEKLIYLNFSSIPVINLRKHLTLLELTANIIIQPDFYFLVLQQNEAIFYEYCHHKLHTVYASKLDISLNETTNRIHLFEKLALIIKRINRNSEKCVFVWGSRNLIELIGNYYSDPFIFFDLSQTSGEKIKILIEQKVQDIVSHWSYWHKKFIIRKIKNLKIKNSLIAGVDELIKALSNSRDGLLVMDKDFFKQLNKLHKSEKTFDAKLNLTVQLERFLRRGNQIEVMESTFVKKLGDVVLLPHEISGTGNLASLNCMQTPNGCDTF